MSHESLPTSLARQGNRRGQGDWVGARIRTPRVTVDVFDGSTRRACPKSDSFACPSAAGHCGGGSLGKTRQKSRAPCDIRTLWGLMSLLVVGDARQGRQTSACKAEGALRQLALPVNNRLAMEVGQAVRNLLSQRHHHAGGQATRELINHVVHAEGDVSSGEWGTAQ